jgi:hypothetical protein
MLIKGGRNNIESLFSHFSTLKRTWVTQKKLMSLLLGKCAF